MQHKWHNTAGQGYRQAPLSSDQQNIFFCQGSIWGQSLSLILFKLQLFSNIFCLRIRVHFDL